MLKPAKLNIGDNVGIFVPSSPVKEPYRSNGIKKVKELGYVPVEVDNIFSNNDFLAKKSEENFDDLQRFFTDKKIKALWAARGGYGSNNLLPLLEKLNITEPKIVIGSSDVSYLLWYLLDNYKMVVFYGPMAYSSLPDNRFEADNLKRILGGDYEEIRIAGKTLIPGNVSGIVTGGCLSNFVSLLGTDFFPLIDNRVLLLEDVGERPFRLDRMFWQLEQAGVFSKIKGLILGEFPNCFKDDKEREFFWQRVEGLLKKYRIPVIYQLPFGHSGKIHTLPLGIEVNIDTFDFSGLIIKEKAVK